MKIQQVLAELGIAYAPAGHHHTRPGWINFDCPFCSKGTRRWRMGYNLARGYVNCWTCGRHGLNETLVESSGASYSQVKQLTADIIRDFSAPEKIRTHLVLPKSLGPLLPAHQRYLKARGFDPDEITRLWSVQGIGIAANLQWRIFIPIHLDGLTVSWTTRAIVDSGQRYISARVDQEAVNHKTILYGEDYCRHAIIVHEGPTDVWATGPGAVGTCGVGFQRAQVARISKYPIRVICFDNQPDAQRRATELCNMLEVYPGETYNVQLSAKDAGSASKKEIKELRKFLL